MKNRKGTKNAEGSAKRSIKGCSCPDAERWDTRYAEEGEEWLERSPRPLLLDYAHVLPSSGLALDAASGVANNGAYLARLGLRVIALDISEIGLRLAMRRARAEDLDLSAAVYDLSTPWLPANRFDVIVNFRFLERTTFRIYRQALKSEGWLFFETFVKTAGDSDRPEYYLDAGELKQAFHDFEILHWKETKIPGSDRATAQLVARKPL
jgi:hypothetical protein